MNKTPKELLRIKNELKCIGTLGNTLIRIDGNTCDDIEKILNVKYNNGWEERYFRRGIDTTVLTSFDEIRKEITYSFDKVPEIDIDEVIYLGNTPDTFDTFVIEREGKVVSRAWSVRKNNEAAEIAVETVETHRRQGLGKKVVAAWVKYQLEHNKVPIYNHRANHQSQALAESIGAIKFAETVSYH